MRHHLRLFVLCTIAVLTASCSDTNEPVDTTVTPEATLSVGVMNGGCTVIGDRVWLDEDCDGLQDKSDAGFTEPGVADVVVNLYTCAGEFVTTTTTDANGFYEFSGIDEYGTYRVCFVLPDGYVFTG